MNISEPRKPGNDEWLLRGTGANPQSLQDGNCDQESLRQSVDLSTDETVPTAVVAAGTPGDHFVIWLQRHSG